MRFAFIFSALFISVLAYSSTSYAQGAGFTFALSMHDSPQKESINECYDYVGERTTRGGTLRQGVVGTFDTLNPFSLKGTAPQGIQYVHDRLMSRSWDEPFTLYAQIADAVKVPKDRSYITFSINPHARFSDLTPITADDVKFTFETLRDHGRPNMRRVYKLVEKVEVPHRREITFRLGKGHDRETVMILAMMPVLSKAWWEGRDFEAAQLESGPTSGPYRVKEFAFGRRIIYEQNPHYWSTGTITTCGLFRPHHYVFDYFRDDSLAFESFIKGDLDVRRETDLNRWQTAYKDMYKVRPFVFKNSRPENVWGIYLNMRRAPLNDIRVRRALSIVMDADRLDKTMMRGMMQRIDSIYPNTPLAAPKLMTADEKNLFNSLSDDLKTNLPPAFQTAEWRPMNNDTAQGLRERLQIASKLLDTAGYVIRNGKRVHAKTGKLLQMELIFNLPADEKVALSWQRQLGKLGIILKVRTLDATSYRNRVMAYDYDAMIASVPSSLSPGSEQALYWGCAAAKEQGRFNYAGFCHPLADYLTAEMPKTTKREDLKTYTFLLDRLVMSSYAFVPLLYNDKDYYAFSVRTMHAGSALYGPVFESFWVQPENEITKSEKFVSKKPSLQTK